MINRPTTPVFRYLPARPVSFVLASPKLQHIFSLAATQSGRALYPNVNKEKFPRLEHFKAQRLQQNNRGTVELTRPSFELLSRLLTPSSPTSHLFLCFSPWSQLVYHLGLNSISVGLTDRVRIGGSNLNHTILPGSRL